MVRSLVQDLGDSGLGTHINQPWVLLGDQSDGCPSIHLLPAITLPYPPPAALTCCNGTDSKKMSLRANSRCYNGRWF